MMRRQRTLGRTTNCAFTAKAGRYVGPRSGPYSICLSELQTKVLFGQRYVDAAQVTKLGCGSWACVWKLPEGRVLKITRDPDDIAAFQAVKGLPHVRKVYADYTLLDAGRDAKTGRPIKLWAQIAKEVDPIKPQYAEWLKGPFCRARISLMTDSVRHRGVGLPAKSFKVSALTRKKIDAACMAVQPGERAECRRFGHSLLTAYEKMYRRGVDWIDMNENNIGMDGKSWVAIDLGISDVALQDRPKELRGMGQPRSRRLPR